LLAKRFGADWNSTRWLNNVGAADNRQCAGAVGIQNNGRPSPADDGKFSCSLHVSPRLKRIESPGWNWKR
jgi:hypothetical protein